METERGLIASGLVFSCFVVPGKIMSSMTFFLLFFKSRICQSEFVKFVKFVRPERNFASEGFSKNVSMYPWSMI